MSRDDAAGVFARRGDCDWDMFCRGRHDEAQAAAWVGRDPAEFEPVPLEADDGGGSERERPSGEPLIRHFYAKVVGVHYPNEDGTSRADAVRACTRGQRVRLVHRPDNPVDVNAVALLRDTPDGPRQLGYLRAALAKDVVAAARNHSVRFLAMVTEVTGAGDPARSLSGEQPGATLLVLALRGGATRDMARRYVLRVINNEKAQV